MTEGSDRPKVRVVTGNVVAPDSRLRSSDEALGRAVADEIKKAGFEFVRHIVVRGEIANIQALVQNVSNENEADAVILLGGAGFGPSDHTCEAIDAFVEKKIEGFAEAYRRLLRSEHGVHSMLSRATAGVFNKCLVFALNGQHADVRLAVEMLIAPVLGEAMDLAYGRSPAKRE
jgi:molybdenum cofactor biosynthesis protein B